MEAKYIYGIIEASEEKLFNLSGADTYEDIYVISYRDIAAIVSYSQPVDYTTLHREQLARRLLNHQQVIEKIMEFYNILPVKFGTHAANTQEVKEILFRGYTKFKDIFKKIHNKIEMDVAATWSDLNSIIKEIGEGEEIKELKEEIILRHEGISVNDQLAAGRRVKQIMDKKAERYSFEIETALNKCSLDFRRHDLMDDRMIINDAFLIEKLKKDEFERTLDELNGRFGEGVNFRSVGPLPLYSFYTVEVKKISFEKVDWARKVLSLSVRTTREEIIKTYRNRAKSYHPDM
ncbi:MAG: GvpL/GvpF family gas vesicle protein, partial [Nitrospirae bacterium]|nr:GvpL/GvpF family gas vesicle protein [Nitrospirota bacterium]